MVRVVDNIDREFEQRVLELFSRRQRGTIITDVIHPRIIPPKPEQVSKRDMQLPVRDRD